MIFGTFPIDDLSGAILAHTVRLNSNKTIKKGTLLNNEHLELLKTAGLSSAMAAKLEGGDVSEDDAAHQIAHALAGKNNAITGASTGRCNLISTLIGVVQIKGDLITKLNLISEAITIATLNPFTQVFEKQILATVKIIPFAVQQSTLDLVLEEIKASPEKALLVSPISNQSKIGLILTNINGGRESLLDKAQQALEIRLSALGCHLSKHLRCGHDIADVSNAITNLNALGCDPIFICGATATVDRDDVVPAAIVHAGGSIDRYGIPVDPGNLLLLASMATPNPATIVVMPGCARSLKLNGFDWVMTRVLAKIPITNDDFARLGVGGLLEEMPSRPLSRNRAVEANSVNSTMPEPSNIGAIILAAGQSTRMGEDNKLLTIVDGRAMLERAIEAAQHSKANTITIVTGHQADKIEQFIKQSLPDFNGTLVHNPDYKNGMSTSVQSGIKSLQQHIDGAVILLGDMPHVKAHHINALIDAFDPEMDQAICVATHQGKRGNPVLWSHHYFAEIMQLSGDNGARQILRQHSDVIINVEMQDDAVLLDIDTKEELDRGRSKI